jgi:DNA-binding NarL/FixJ family response regulator
MSPSQDTSIRLRMLIIDPHEVSRAAVRALLQTEGLEVVADASSGKLALALGDMSLDIAVVDISHGTTEALKVAAALARLPAMLTVVLTSSTAPDAHSKATRSSPSRISVPDDCAARWDQTNTTGRRRSCQCSDRALA